MSFNLRCRTASALALFFNMTLLGTSALLAQTEAESNSAATSPGVRIVRLSQVKGEVELNRGLTVDGSKDFTPAFLNVPITQGAALKTGAGVAEVEFEDNSTLRLTPDTSIEFIKLSRDHSGQTASSVRVLQGTLFVSLSPTKGSEFTVTSNQGTLALTPSTRIHFQVGAPNTTLAVLDGSVQAQVGTNTTTAFRKTSLVFDPASQAPPTVVKHLEKTPYDDWDKTAVDYHQRSMNTSSFGNAFAGGNALYGVSDMNYYGSFSDAGGCGSMWRPYLASAAWDPYSNGTMAYYPSNGYSWVSPYPWGWTPYHSGTWVDCSGTGWGWQPNGNFSGLNNLDAVVMKRHGIPTPPAPPKTGHGVLLNVNRQPVRASGFAGQATFVFNKDSAGLGVPRQTFGRLDRISAHVEQHGFATIEAYSSPASLSASFASQPPSHAVSFAHAGPNPASAFSSASLSRAGASSSSRSSASLATASSAGMSHGAASSTGAAPGGAHH